jgi:hypothetical protein
MGVKVDKVAEEVTGRFEKVTMADVPAGSVAGAAGFAYAIDPRANDAFRAVNRLLKAGDSVYRTTASIDVGGGGADWPAGTFLVTVGTGTQARVEDAARTLGLNVRAIDQAPSSDLLRVTAPRVALYQGWGEIQPGHHLEGGNVDEGWTRWLLEQFEFPLTSLHNQELQAGNLRAKYDVILLPNSHFQPMLDGLAPGTVPPEFSGGMGILGVANLYTFVTNGGTLVAMDNASELPLMTFSLQVRNALADVPRSVFYTPGTLLRLKLDTRHPIAYGMPTEAVAFFARSPAFSVGRPQTQFEEEIAKEPPPPENVRVVGEYPEKDVLLSGWSLGEHLLSSRAAIVEATVEKGRVVLLGFRTQHRAQAHGTFKLLFNSIYLSTSEKAKPGATTDNDARR